MVGGGDWLRVQTPETIPSARCLTGQLITLVTQYQVLIVVAVLGIRIATGLTEFWPDGKRCRAGLTDNAMCRGVR
jgi:hypothetical protein